MPTIAAVATAVPPHEVAQPVARALAERLFTDHLPNIARYLPVFEHAEIDTRYVSAPLNWFAEPHSFGATNDRFIEVACEIGAEAARAALGQAKLQPADIDHIIVVTTTGLASPSLDARLITLLGLRRTTRRTPIWGLGCAGGLGGLARAEEYVRAFPTHRVLLVTVELCSLTLQWDDRSKRNLVALSLFGDGAAALVVAGDAVGAAGPQILGTRSTLFPDSLDLMGWDVVDSGFRVVFGAGIPAVVRSDYAGLAGEFLAEHGLTPALVPHHIYHPGGAKVLRAYEQALDLDPAALDHSRAVLRRYGNMSSATIFFVLAEFLQRQTLQPGDHGLLCVFGPGFSADLALLRMPG